MSALGNKEIMAKNIKYYMSLSNVSQTELCNTLGIKMPTFSDWIHAKTYPRIDKIELMANYFGITKADLVEEHTNKDTVTIQKNSYENKLISEIQNLNDNGKIKLIDTAREMACNPLYNDNYLQAVAAHERTDIEVTADMIKHDDDIMDDDNF